jgi:O-antigen/teichoic acid export membrane protein
LFSTLDYIRLLDLGVRPAVVNGCARYAAARDWERFNATVTTALAYSVVVTGICLVAVLVWRQTLLEAATVSSPLRALALNVVVPVSITVGARLVTYPLTGTLEGLQRFDVLNRTYMGSLLVRSLGSVAVLFAGYGLIAMAWIVLAAQAGESLFTWYFLRRVCPQLAVSPSRVQRATLADLFRYGRYSAVISTSNLVTFNAPPVILGYMRSAAEVAYFSLPYRVLMYVTEGLTKVADVTASVSAAIHHSGDRQRLWRLAVLTNRHCFALFVPLAVYLSFYGTPLLRLWITPEMAEHSGYLFPIMVLSFAFAIAGQYNAGAVLLGQARHAAFAYGVAVEAAATIVLLVVFVPSYGALGAAWVMTTIGLLIRGAYLATAFCWQNDFPLGQYVQAVYGRALVCAVPICVLAFLVRGTLLPGNDWSDLLLAATIVFGGYFALAFFWVLEADHREQLMRRLPIRRGSAH